MAEYHVGCGLQWICPMMFGVDCPSKSATSTQMCTTCRNHSIPAEIAEKLGIKPITQGEAGSK